MAGINPELYESAAMDGANKLQQIRHITLPSISYVIAIMLIFAIGGLLNAGFEQILLLYSPSVYQVADIIDTYVYRSGLLSMQYSFASAVGLFKSILALVLMLIANSIAKRVGQPGLW
jgi:putative aldouronate transport system permease protein